MKTETTTAATEKANAATKKAEQTRKLKDHIAAAWAHDAAMKALGECLTEKTSYRDEAEIQSARGHHQAMANWHWKKAATARL
jgi:hypothetical protein